MKIAPDPKAWKPWRRAVRGRVKANPDLKKAHRKASKLRFVTNNDLAVFRFVVPVIIGFLVWHNPASAVPFGFMTLWTFVVTAARIQQVANACHFPGELWLFYSWPLSDDDVFAHQRRLVLRASLWLGLDWIVFGCVLALRTADPTLLAAGQWAAALSIALFMGRIFPRFPYTWISTGLGILLFVGGQFAAKNPALLRYLDSIHQVLLAATPGGWLLQSWQLIAAGNAFGWLALVLLSGSAAATLGIGARLVRAAFNPETIFGYHTAPEIEAGDAPSDAPAAPSIPVAPDRVRAALDTPSGRAFTARGPVERSLGWFLTRRQRVLVDFMFPGGSPWHHRWMIAAILLTLAFVLRQTAPGFAAIPALLAMLFALPVIGGRWSGFTSIAFFQTQIPLLAYAPVGFREIAGLILKINTLYCLLALPIVITGMALGLEPADASPLWSLDHGLRVTAILLALQPIFVIGKFSANSNDSSAGKLFTLGIAFVILAGLVVGISLCVVAMMTDRFPVALACIGSLILLTHALLALYGFAWGRGWFDQMARIRE